MVQIASKMCMYSESKCKECESQEQELEAIGDVLQGAIKVAKVDHKYFPVEAKLERNPSYIFVRGSEADTIRLFQ